MKANCNKGDLLKALLPAIQMTRGGSDIVDLSLADTFEEEDTVLIEFKNGAIQAVNIACDSGMAIIRDVCHVIR